MSLITILTNLPVLMFLIFNIPAAIAFAIAIGKRIFPKAKSSSNEEPKVSILITSWKEGKKIKKCLDSVVNQNYPRQKREIIVVAGGDPESVEVCRKFQERGLINFFHEKKMRPKSEKLNFMVGRAKYEWIAFIDADCTAKKEWLKTLVSKKDEGDILTTPFIFKKGNGFFDKVLYITTQYFTFINVNLAKVFNLGYFFGINALMKKSIFEKIKFKKSFVEDFLFSVEAIKRGMKVKVIDKFLVTQAKPKTFSELRKIYLKHTQGFLSDILPKGNQLAIFYMLLLILSVLGLPFTYFSIKNGGAIFIAISLANFLFIFATLLLVSKKEGKLS